MKKLFSIIAVTLAMGAMLQGCSSKNENVNNSQKSAPSNNTTSISDTTVDNNTSISDTTADNNTKSKITEKIAYAGVNNYCHSEYDWSAAEDNPSMMYIEMGEETEKEYQVVFHSYTGAIVNFYVDKSTGNTKIVEYVPALDIENEVGTINIYDYLEE